ncbi:MAG: PP2C family protein-serine/threonine phosphatase [Magnetospiraceae bacterium]
MGIRAKLLIVLLLVAVPPLGILTVINRMVTATTGDALVAERRISDERAASEELVRMVSVAADRLDRARALLESDLRATILQVQQKLTEGTGEQRYEAVLSLFEDGLPAPPLPGVERGAILQNGDTAYLVGTAEPPQALDLETVIDPNRSQWYGDHTVAAVVKPIIGKTGRVTGHAFLSVPPGLILEGVPLRAAWRGSAVTAVIIDVDRSVTAVVPESDLETAGQLAKNLPATGASESASWVQGPDDRYLVSFQPMPVLPVSVLVAVPEHQLAAGMVTATDRINALIGWQWKVGGMALLLFGTGAVLLALIGARLITQPIDQLRRTARRIAEGDLDARANIHTGDELEELSNGFNAMVPKLRERMKMRNALDLAMEVQQQLLPSEKPLLPGFDMAGMADYCDETGGDYFDFFEVDSAEGPQMVFVVGDVTGHGVAAALLMTTGRALLRSHFFHGSDLDQVVTVTNQHLAKDATQGRFMSLFVGMVMACGDKLCWVNAGHGPGHLYLPAEDRFELLEGQDIPLAIDPEWAFSEQVLHPWPIGAVLVIGTDGVWETKDKSGEMFGVERLHAVIRAHAQQEASVICAEIEEAVFHFREGAQTADDLTVMAIKRVATEATDR